MDSHRDVFKVLHPRLQLWLDDFDEGLVRFSGPTYIYNSLVMLGIERPNNPEVSGSRGCDCLTVISEEMESIVRHERDIRDWNYPSYDYPSYVVLKRNSIVQYRESIALYEAMHASHADFNHRVHFALRNSGSNEMLGKVRAVCLRDLRYAAKNNGQGRIAANPDYGRELATFLVPDPKGWW